jgi:mono/diheme cytochrome c family protein
VLDRVDSVLAVLSWIAAAALVLMLFIGPEVIAHDKGPAVRYSPAAGAGAGGAAAGKQVFSANCGSCHTLKAAGTSGQVGPDLDGVSLGAGEIEAIVRSGRGAMPAFGGRLSDAQIAAVAAFVSGQR